MISPSSSVVRTSISKIECRGFESHLGHLVYRCKKCDKEFFNRKSYIGHCSSHYRTEKYKVGRKILPYTQFELTGKHECRFCSKQFNSGIQLGGHVTKCVKNPNNNVGKNSVYKKHNKNTRIKMSLSRKLFLQKNMDKHPWKYSRKFVSVPCQYLKKILSDNNLNYEEEFSPLIDRSFSIDIAFPEYLLGLEVNGNQHYNKNGTLKSYYRKRHKLIESKGWKLIQIKYKKVYDEKFITKLLNTIGSM